MLKACWAFWCHNYIHPSLQREMKSQAPFKDRRFVILVNANCSHFEIWLPNKHADITWNICSCEKKSVHFWVHLVQESRQVPLLNAGNQGIFWPICPFYGAMAQPNYVNIVLLTHMILWGNFKIKLKIRRAKMYEYYLLSGKKQAAETSKQMFSMPLAVK